MVTELLPNSVYIFLVKANNKAGEGIASEKYAVRTLPEGAAAMTPWELMVDDRSGKVYYSHKRSKAIAWMLPKGALIDESESFRNKKAWLTKRLACRSEEVRMSKNMLDSNGNLLFHSTKICVDRGDVMEQSLALLHRLPPADMIAGPVRVTFTGEEGIDAGGVAKDWFQELMRKITEGTVGLMKSTETGVHIDIRASEIHGSDTRWLFKSLGVLIAKAIIDNQILGVSFSPLFLTLLKGSTPQLEDLLYSDPEFYNGLKWIEDNNVENADLPFSASYEDMFGESKTVVIGDFGENTKVTEDNKKEYISLMVEWLCRRRYEPCLSHLYNGFYSLMREGDLK